MRADAAILLFVTPFAFPSPLTWSSLANSLMPKWASDPSFPSNRFSSEPVTDVAHFLLLLDQVAQGGVHAQLGGPVHQ